LNLRQQKLLIAIFYRPEAEKNCQNRHNDDFTQEKHCFTFEFVIPRLSNNANVAQQTVSKSIARFFASRASVRNDSLLAVAPPEFAVSAQSVIVMCDTQNFIHDKYREKYRDTRYIAILICGRPQIL